MKLATWNVNSLAVRLPQLLDWLAANPVDVIALQETKLPDEKFPQAEIEAAGYQVQWFGQKTYNGVALLSKRPASDVVRNIPGFDDAQKRVIAGTLALADGTALRCASSAPTFPTARRRAARSSTTRCSGCARCANGCATNSLRIRAWC